MSIRDTATAFAVACDAGEGWEVCKQWCTSDATFACQANALSDVTSLEGYVEWAKGLLTPIPKATCQVRVTGVDQERSVVMILGLFEGTHTGEGGPVPPTGKAVASDYVYSIEFAGDKISHVRKIWNDGFALSQLGWA